MLNDLLEQLAKAHDKESKEKAYRNLGYVGMDRMTADMLVRDMFNSAAGYKTVPLENGN